jgi:predicted nucleic acid-binding protein
MRPLRVNDVVVDASVAAKWVIEEAYSAQAVQLLVYDARYAPDHWQAEAVNALWWKVFKADLTATDAQERLTVLLRAPVIGVPIADMMPRAFAISVATGVTIYDSLYCALAEKRNIPLVTADERLIRQMSGNADFNQRLIWVGDLSLRP